MTESFAKPFGTDVSSTSTIAAASGTSWVSVAELLTNQITVQSFEAVAVIAELCAVLLGRGTNVIPHAADVLVNDEGRLSIRGGDDGDADSAALGRLLHSLIATAPTSAPLRLFVLNAMSSERYQSVSAFAEALAAYEVPGRDKLIQAVHHRWVATRAAGVSPALVPPRSEPEQEEKPPAKRHADGRRIPRWAIATVSVVVVFGGATGAWFAAGGKPLSIPSVSLSVPAVIQNALGWLDATTPGDSAAAEPEIKNTKRPRAARPKTAAAQPSTSDAGLDTATATAMLDTTPVSGSADAPVTTEAPDGVTSTSGIDSDTSTPIGAAASPAPAAIGKTPDTSDDVAAADSKVYSSAFPGIKPPVIITQQITPAETLTSGVEATSTIELLVDESGGVERVRLLSRPSPILATMLLSAAKNWKFKPALSDGHPVKYRLLLDVATTQR